MSFYRADKRNDKERHVVRKNSYRLSDFWASGRPGGNFMITGGSESEQVWALYGAVRDYLSRKGRSVIVIHNNNRLDSVLYEQLYEKEKLAEVYRIFDSEHASYQPFQGMSISQIKTCVEGQCELLAGIDTPAVTAYAKSLLTILKKCDEDISLVKIKELCGMTDQEIVRLAERAGVDDNVKNGIVFHSEGGMSFRNNVLERLEDSGGYMLAKNDEDDRKNNIYSLLSDRDRERDRHILSIHLNAYNPDSIFRCLMDEIQALENQEFLLVFYDVNLSKSNGGLRAIENRAANYSLGLCSKEVSGMFPVDAGEAFKNVRAIMKKKAIFHYDDADAAEKVVSGVFGEYEHEATVKVVAPAKPWEIFKAKAPGKAKSMELCVTGSEVTEMEYGAGILSGHQGNEIYFVKRLEF